MTQPLPERRRRARDAELFVLRDYDDTGLALDGLRRGGGGGGQDPALEALLVLRRAVDAQAADLAAAASEELSSSGSRGHGQRTRWSRLLPAAACAVLVVGGVVLGTGREHSTAPTPAAAAETEPVMTLLAAAEADLQSAFASAPEAQPALIEHSRQLVDEARTALATLPPQSRASVTQQLDAVDARLASVRTAGSATAPAPVPPAPAEVEAAAASRATVRGPGSLPGAGNAPIPAGPPSTISLPRRGSNGFSEAPRQNQPAAEPGRASRSGRGSSRPEPIYPPRHKSGRHTRGR